MNKILVFGSANIDDVYAVDHIVKPGETTSATKYETFPGGKGLNQSVACVRAGADTYFAGKIGEDGAFLKAFLDEAGVNTKYMQKSQISTGRAIIQVANDGINSIIVNDGANGDINLAMVDEVLVDFDSEDILIMQNELVLTPILLDKAFDKGMKIVFNPSPINDRVKSCDLSKVTWLFINETEGFELSKKTNPNEIMDEILKMYPEIKIILTLGADGSVYADKNEMVVASACEANVVDTTGAGDTFTGYFINGIMNNFDIKSSLNLASKASSITVSRKGAAVSIPTMEEVLAQILAK